MFKFISGVFVWKEGMHLEVRMGGDGGGCKKRREESYYYF